MQCLSFKIAQFWFWFFTLLSVFPHPQKEEQAITIRSPMACSLGVAAKHSPISTHLFGIATGTAISDTGASSSLVKPDNMSSRGFKYFSGARYKGFVPLSNSQVWPMARTAVWTCAQETLCPRPRAPVWTRRAKLETYLTMVSNSPPSRYLLTLAGL